MKKTAVLLLVFGVLVVSSCNRKSTCPAYDSKVVPAQK